MKYSEVDPAVERKAPLETVELPANAWKDDFLGRPSGPVTVGIRFLSGEDHKHARVQAGETFKLHDHPDDIIGLYDTYNDTLMHWCVARGICDPFDVSQPFMQALDDNVWTAFTSEGVRFLYDAIERHRVLHSPVMRGATDKSLLRLGALLLPLEDLVGATMRILDELGPSTDTFEVVGVLQGMIAQGRIEPPPPLERLDPVRAKSLRKLLQFAFEELGGETTAESSAAAPTAPPPQGDLVTFHALE